MSWINNKNLLDFPAAALEYFYEIIFGDYSPQGVITDFNRNVDETTTQQTSSLLASLLVGDEINLYFIFLSVSFFHFPCLCRLSVIYFICIYFVFFHFFLFCSPSCILYTNMTHTRSISYNHSHTNSPAIHCVHLTLIKSNQINKSNAGWLCALQRIS